MSDLVPNKRNLQLKHTQFLLRLTAAMLCCKKKKKKKTCKDWFRCLKKNDFNADDKEHSGTPKKFEDEVLGVLHRDDSCQEQSELAELKPGHWGTVEFGAEKRQAESCHMWTAASTTEMERFFTLYHDRRWKKNTQR